jgi:FAD/FMN-containing dehydrogenase
MGGGHGPLSNQYGMGCDNILEMTVVLANGTTVITNEDSYPDLFYALQGGGGGTYGLVLQTTMKAYPLPTMHGVRITITPSVNNNETFLHAVAYWLSKSTEMTDFGISGYPDLSSRRFSGRFRAPDKSPSQIERFLAPILEHLEVLGANFTLTTVGNSWSTLFVQTETKQYEAPYQKYYAAQSNAALQPRQYRPSAKASQMLSRLLSRDALVESNQPAIRTMLKTVLGSGAFILPYPVAGGQVARNRNLNVGLNPAWRDAVMHLIVINSKNDSNLKAIDTLSANSGAYLNEGYALEADWKKTFFGGEARYAKLLQIKQKYDPTYRFWCKPCIGGDSLSVGALGHLQLPG